ncbi:MAG TPA: MG2 domain-containing protein [Chitinivibrionales bacterium]|nr:MG2 domain-containing protein [Chitinivibrionales bacterium]
MKRAAALVLLCLIAVSCQKKHGEKGLPPAASVQELINRPLDLNKTVVGKPPAIISVLATIDIIFNEPVVPPHLSGTALDRSPFGFKPEIKGAAKWVSQTELRFTPNKPLGAGVTYEAVLHGKEAFGAQRNVNDFEFSFKTAEQEVVEFSGDFEPDTGGLNTVRYRGYAAFAQPVDINKIRNDLKCETKGRSVKLGIEQDGQDQGRVKITSEQLKRGASGQMLAFSLPGSYTVDKGKWTAEAMLPEINVFKVLAHMDMSDPQAAQSAYGFRFSDPIRTGTDLSGYVKIEPPLPFTVSVEKKFLKLSAKFLIGQEYTVTIAKGFPSSFGTRLAATYTAEIALANLKPELLWLSPGIYLPSDNNFRLQFKSVNVGKVHCRITEIYENNLGFFIQSNLLSEAKAHGRSRFYYDEDEGEGDYYGGYEPNQYNDVDRVGKCILDSELVITTDRNKWIRSEIDLSHVFKGRRNAGFIVNLRFNKNDLTGRCVTDRDDIKEGDLFYAGDNYYNTPAQEGYYYRNGNKSKLLIASDVGLTIKQAADGLHAYAVNVIDAKPEAGLTLGLYTYQNQLVQKQTTDASGHALFSDPSNGYYLRGDHSAGIALIRLDHPNWETSSFDVAGVDEGVKGLNMFIYADRGVHRPGDTVHLAAIVRANRKAPPADQPVTLKVYNPKEQVVYEAMQKCGPNGHVYFAIVTGISDPTGSWRAALTIADQTFTKELKIETVKPNRLKVFIQTPDTLTPGSTEIAGVLESRFLFGMPSAGLRAKMLVDLSPVPLRLAAWDDYTFGHPLAKFQRRAEEMFDQSLDNNGRYSFSYDADDAKNAPELVSAVLRAEVFEKGGGFTSNNKKVLIAPYRSYCGFKSPFASSWGSAQTGQTYQLPIIVTGLNGKPVPGHKLTVKWYVNKGYWWWDYDSRSKPDFRELKTTYKVAEYTLVSSDKPVKQALEVEDEGENFIEITDAVSGHTCGMFFWASSWGAGPAQEKKERVFLQIASDKNLYYTGDRMQVSCETPQKGMVLFTLEQGARILHQEIKQVTPGRTSFTLDITEDMVPNCYAVLSLIQPHSQVKNDVPMRIYGVKPIAVEDFSTRLQLTMSAPAEIKPKDKFDITVTSKSPETATYTIAVVDEGLLDLTGFETPDPWKFFFSKLRLGVVTRDNLEEVLGIIYPDIDKRFSIGGDMEEARKRAGESKVQRFKPVVLFAGPIAIKPGKSVTTRFEMPNYVGSVRIMLIGSAQNSYASVEKTVPVRQPLMILTTVPRVARPGDRFYVPVSVFAMDKSVDTATVSIKVSGPLSLAGPAIAGCRFGQPGETEVSFLVDVLGQIGAGKIVVNATGRGQSASDEVDLPVTCPNPYYIQAIDTVVTKGKSVTMTPKKFGIEPTNRARFSFTRFPDIQIEKRYKDLIHYPYGCIEQTTSSAFPQLFIGSLLDLTSVEKQMVTDNVNAAINKLSSFRIGNGFSYWPLGSWYAGEYADWCTSYAGHFLIEARSAGYHVPDDLFNHWLDNAEREAKTVNSRDHRYQCYRLFLLSLAGRPNQGAMNLVRENYLRELDPLSKKLLAAAYYLAGQKPAAAEVDKFMVTEISTYREMSGTYGSSLRDMAFVAYLDYKMGDMTGAARVLSSVAKSFYPWGWYSTQETSFSLLAISTVYAKSPITGGAVPFTVSVRGGKTEKLVIKAYQTKLDANDLWDKEVSISTESDNPMFVTLFEEGIPIDNRIKTEQKGIELTRNFYDEDGAPITIEQIRQGDGFWVRYRVRSTTHERLTQLALSSLFPSGWEIINNRLEGTELPEWVNNLNATNGTYMDIRDDRVNWFFDLGYNNEANFVVKCNPTFKGVYKLPPITVEPMYSPDYYARIGGAEVSVK